MLIDRARREGARALHVARAHRVAARSLTRSRRRSGIKVQLWRAQSAEGRAACHHRGEGRRFTVDVVETNGPEMEMMAREKLLGELAFALSGGPAGQCHSRAPHVVSRPHELLRRGLQHREGAAQRDSRHVSRLHRPEVEGPHRHRGDRRRMDGDARSRSGALEARRADLPQARGTAGPTCARATYCWP